MFAPRNSVSCGCGFSANVDTEDAAKELFHAHTCKYPSSWHDSFAGLGMVLSIVAGIVLGLNILF